MILVSYSVERKNALGATGKEIISSGLTSKNYNDGDVVQGETYIYSIVAEKNGITKRSDDVIVDTVIQEVDLIIFADSTTFPSNDIVDKSRHNRWIYRHGNTSIVSPLEYPKNIDDGWIKFDGVGDCIQATIPEYGYSDFSFEVFLVPYFNVSKNSARILQIGDTTSGTFIFHRYQDTSMLALTVIAGASYNTFLITSNSLVSGEGYHIEVHRKNNVFSIVVNGVEWGSSELSFDITKTNLSICANNAKTEELSAYMSGIRLTRFSRYNPPFLPPSFKYPTI